MTVTLNAEQVEEIVQALCTNLECQDALYPDGETPMDKAHQTANDVLDKLIAAGATRENFQAWGRRWEMRFKVDWVAGYGDCEPQVFTIDDFENKELWRMNDILGDDWKASLCQMKVGEFKDCLIVSEHIRFTRVK